MLFITDNILFKLSESWIQCPSCESLFSIECANSQIQGRSQTLYTVPCNGVVSHGLKLGVFGDLANHARKSKRKANMSTTFARCPAFLSIFTLRLQYMQVTFAPEKPVILITEKPTDSQFDPHARIKMAQVVGSPLRICGADELGHLPPYSHLYVNMSVSLLQNIRNIK